MITLSYKESGTWTEVEGFECTDDAHEYAIKHGYNGYKLMNGTRPIGVYSNSLPAAETKPAKPKKPAKAEAPDYTADAVEPNEPKVTLEELADEWDDE